MYITNFEGNSYSTNKQLIIITKQKTWILKYCIQLVYIINKEVVQ